MLCDFGFINLKPNHTVMSDNTLLYVQHVTYIKDVVRCIEADWNECIKVVRCGINIEYFKVALHCILIWEDGGQCWVQEE